MRALPLVLCLLLAAGCGQSGFSKRSSEGKETIVRIAIDTSPTTFDPTIVQDLDTGDLLLNLFEGLVGEEPEWAPPKREENLSRFKS